MRSFKRLWFRFAHDEQGGEVLEYAIVAGLIVVGALTAIASVGTKVLNTWNGLDTGMK